MVILCVLVLVLLVAAAAVSPVRTTLSSFELKRRVEAGDKDAIAVMRRDSLLPDILSLQRIVVALLLVVFVLLSVAAWGWLVGVLVAVLVALEYGAIARVPPVQRQMQKRYEQYEKHLLDFVEKYHAIFRLVRNVTPPAAVDIHLDSREELLQLTAQSGGLLSADEKHLIANGLGFADRPVSDVMTPRGVIDSISKRELLGPLVLDDLHKTGHSRFPVTDGDIDHVVGMLYIQNLLTVDSGKRSTTAEKTMEPRVFYIRQDQTLGHALAAFLRTHHHLFIVINEFRETVGLLSLEDVVEALLGRKIIDEFDTHEDLRVVAARNPRGINRPEKREDV